MGGTSSFKKEANAEVLKGSCSLPFGLQEPPKSVAKILKMTGVLNFDHEKPVTHFSVSLNVLF